MAISLKPDIKARIVFYTKVGKALNPSTDVDIHATVVIKGEYFDCKVLLSQIGIEQLDPGQAMIVPIKFMHPEFIIKDIILGESFKFWAGKIIGEGEVVEVVALIALNYSLQK